MDAKYYNADGDEITRDTECGSYDGSLQQIKDLEDTHILNISVYLEDKLEKYEQRKKQLLDEEDPFDLRDIKIERYDELIKTCLAFIGIIKDEIELRELDIALVKEGPIPFKDKNGRDMEWSVDEGKPMRVSNTLKYLKNLTE